MKKISAVLLVGALFALTPQPVKGGDHVGLVKAFSPSADKPITLGIVTADQGGWRIDPASAGAVRLFEVAGLRCDACRLVYRAKVKTRDLPASAFLEMWVRVPHKGEFFSRGLDQTVSGSLEWTSVEIPFFFQKGERADLVKLNVSFNKKGGSLWIKDVELREEPLP